MAERDSAPPLGLGVDFTDPNSRLAPYYLTTGQLLGGLTVFLIATLYAFVPLWHTDVWAHLRFGQLMLAGGPLPEHEPFTPFADKTAPIVHGQWLTQVIYAAVFSYGEGRSGFAGGVEALRGVHAVALLVRLGLLYLAYWRVGGSPGLALAGLLATVMAQLSPMAVQRPQAFGVMCFAAVMFLLTRPSRRTLWLLPMVMVLWANLHGSYVVGLAFAGLVTLGRLVDRVPEAKTLALIVGISVVAVAMGNPHGPSLFAKTLAFGEHPNLRTIAEWAPIHLTLGRGPIWTLALSLAFVASAVGCRALPVRTETTLLMGLFGIWPFFQERAMVWWLTLAPWLAIPYLAALTEPTRQRMRDVASFRKTLALLGFGGVLVLWSPGVQWLLTGTPGPLDRTLSRETPYQLADWFAASGRTPGPIFTTETQGDFLLARAPIAYEIGMYTHAHLFTPEYWSECRSAINGEPTTLAWLDRKGFQYVTVEPQLAPRLVKLLESSPQWTVIAEPNWLAVRKSK